MATRETGARRDDGFYVTTGVGVIAAIMIAVLAMAVSLAGRDGTQDAAARPPATEEAATAAEVEPATEPARTPTIDEISRHPTDLPASADLTRYADGSYSDEAKRSGPITQEVHFRIEEGVAEVLPGTTMEVWTFEGTVPGPMIRGRVGDTIDFFLHNPEDSSMPHNVDFHAVTGPGGGAERLDAAPGAVSEVKVKLLRSGIYVYHCAFPDVPTHIAHGMYGLIVVEPEEGLPPVDHEYYIMQHEYYTNRGGDLAAGQLADAGHLAFSAEHGRLEQPTFVVFNGRPEAVAGDRALGVLGEPVDTGQSVRMFVGNIGPNLVSSFHVIGEIFDRVYVEGSFDLVNESIQTTLVPAGGATGVEFTVEVPGDYILVDHAIFRVHKGAMGVLHAEGPDRPGIFESIEYSEGLRGAE